MKKVSINERFVYLFFSVNIDKIEILCWFLLKFVLLYKLVYRFIMWFCIESVIVFFFLWLMIDRYEVMFIINEGKLFIYIKIEYFYVIVFVYGWKKNSKIKV